MSSVGSYQLVGAAGVYYVAARLNALGYHAAPTFGNVPNIDLLVSAVDGSRSISLQVKTADWALRLRGTGEQRKPHHYEWDIGWKSARLNKPDLVFALVHLKSFQGLPDVFLVPSSVMCKYFEDGNPETWKRARYHETVQNLEEFKNNWELLKRKLL